MQVRNNKELFFRSGPVFVIQIAMILLHSTQFAGREAYQPLRYLYGDGYALSGFYTLEQNMWLINLALYCVMTIQKIVQFREENSYMEIARYPSFRQYYQSVYRCFIAYTVVYQLAVFLGAAAGYGIIRTVHTVDEINWLHFVLSQLCLLIGNLFFGILMFYGILHKNFVKWIVVLYPGVPVFALLSGEYLPRAVSNLIPGSWMMFARSWMFSEGGFFLWGVLLVEMLSFVLLSRVAMRRRPH